MSDAADKLMCSGLEWERAGPRSEAVAVMMSGGVDSSVAAAMLKRAGCDVVGVTMQIPSAVGPDCPGAELQACCGRGASRVARQLGVPHYFVDVRDAFRQFVIEHFRDAYRNGLTPSPCIDCNTHIKFDIVMRLVRETFGIEQVVTGHYARIVESDTGPRLHSAADTKKDQSYFLYGIRRENLARIRFPLGDRTKEQTREATAAYGLDFDARSESSELCFAEQGDYRVALGGEPDAGPGEVVDIDGKVIGTHNGISRYTIGQREGLGIAGGVPLYVVRIDVESNRITLGDRAAASSRTVPAHKLNVLVPETLNRGGRFRGKIRSTEPGSPCSVADVDAGRGTITVEFDKQRHGVTPGQHLVLYTDDGCVVAGAEIARRS